MKQHQGRLVFGWWSRAGGITSTTAQGWPNTAELLPLRFMTAKAPNRAAVHGHRPPSPRVVDIFYSMSHDMKVLMVITANVCTSIIAEKEEQVEKVIEKGKEGKEEKEKKRQEVEKAVDSKINRSRSEGDTCPPETTASS
ncbi:hypothetical protein C1H46_005713 [Malus baccata]|uniref:Uncharacterized protein n=1 Tax=Malus baccata TaxID=106549 RepID=A0A540NCG5_MALBA|nr:hypothetical protein C1H46_005713 [Malus baccata]